MTETVSPKAPDKRLAAVCGLFCPSCTLYIGTQEEPSRLEALARLWGKRVEDLLCDGCRSDRRCFFCRSACQMAKCASDKGVDFCSACVDYPCPTLKEFQAQAPHRADLWRWLGRIRDAGFERWWAEVVVDFSCPACGTINSAYDLRCRKCGAEPGSAFSARHSEEIKRYRPKR